MRVDSNMTRSVMAVSPDDTLDEVYEIMCDQEIRHLPVVEGTKLVGVISERDVLLRVQYEDGEIVVPDIPVDDVMTTEVITCSPKSVIADVAFTMLDKKIGCLPVTDGEELIGMITTSDLLDILCRWKEQAGKTVIPFDFQISSYAGREAKPRPWVQ